MKFSLVVLACSFLMACSNNSDSDKRPANPLGLGPQGGEEPKQPDHTANQTDQEKLQPILDLGQRAVKWLNIVNEKRDLQNRLNLADRTTKNPVPPEKPKVASTQLMLERFNDRVNHLPAEMKPYLLENKDLVEAPPVTDEVFIKTIRELNGVYQGAVRWIGQMPYLSYYAENDVYDIRGVYFFKKEVDLEQKLINFGELDEDTQTKYKAWMISLCHNSSLANQVCKDELLSSVPLEFYKKYLPMAEKTYDGFFKVEKYRNDLTWNEEKSVVTQDFIDPKVEKISTWLKTNVEEEWKLQGFQLLIQFVENNEFSPFLEFVKGVTPHVSGETYNKITMDPDYSLDDYDTQWTIRHEFGHILGFPDCYLEFFDSEKSEMTYYTIEPDNLMCAWGGKLQQSHADELKRVY
jgi:hypothetical protein